MSMYETKCKLKELANQKEEATIRFAVELIEIQEKCPHEDGYDVMRDGSGRCRCKVCLKELEPFSYKGGRE